MSFNLVSRVPENAKVFMDWDEVSEEYTTKSGWDFRNQKVEGEEPRAYVQQVTTRYCSTIDASFEDVRHIGLYHIDQTRPLKKIDKKRLARQKFHKYFISPAAKDRFIRWSNGSWSDNTEDRFWDKESGEKGWKTTYKRISWAKTKEHLAESEIYGVYGDRKAQQFGWCPYAMIDLDLHKQFLDLFTRRLDVLLSHFHGRFNCHFQVEDTGAKGIHFFFFQPNQFLLSKIIAEVKKLHVLHPDCEFLKPNGKLNIEVYPDLQKAHRLPMARGRSMLTDSAIPKMKNGKNDVVSYINWLDHPDKSFMPANEVRKYLFERLDLTCQKIDGAGEPKQQSTSATSKPSEKRVSSSNKMKGKTREKLVGYWRDQEPEHFKHFNSALLTLLQALHAEGLDQDEAMEVAEGYVVELDNPELSSRLGGNNSLLTKEIGRTADKVWSNPVNKKWRVANDTWHQYDFKVSDKSTWIVRDKLDDVVIDCEEVEFNEAELELISSRIAPVLFGKKQALKPEKQQVAADAVAYFLRYVKCCQREIPTYGAVPQILGEFPINWGKKEKQSKFFNALKELDWIYVRTEFYHPNAHGAGVVEIKPRARSYGVGAGMIGKFSSSTTPQPQRSITVLPFLEIDKKINSIIKPFRPQPVFESETLEQAST